MKTITFAALRDQIERKKAAIGGIEDETRTDTLRNLGAARSATKREMLSRMDQRALASGRMAPKANY